MDYKKKVIKKDLIYPELSYQIIGILFEVYNQLGPGYHEKYYQRAIATELKRCNLSFKEQILNYLKVTGLKLGILANFGSKDLKFKRIINL